MPGARGEVSDRTAVKRHAVCRIITGEDRVDRLQQRLGGAERNLERDDAPLPARGGDPRLEMRPHLDKGARVGALKAVDRLFGIADGKNRAVALAEPDV